MEELLEELKEIYISPDNVIEEDSIFGKSSLKKLSIDVLCKKEIYKNIDEELEDISIINIKNQVTNKFITFNMKYVISYKIEDNKINVYTPDGILELKY